jgi:hypothetical protein
VRWPGGRALVFAVMVAMPLVVALAPQEAQIYRIYDDVAKCLDGTPPGEGNSVARLVLTSSCPT